MQSKSDYQKRTKYYLHHPESSCVFIEYRLYNIDTALMNGCELLSFEEYVRLRSIYNPRPRVKSF